jgi:hypothetical protein
MVLNGVPSKRPVWIRYTDCFRVFHRDESQVAIEEIVDPLPQIMEREHPEEVFQFFRPTPGKPEMPVMDAGSGRRHQYTLTDPAFLHVQSSREVFVASHTSQTTEEPAGGERSSLPSLLRPLHEEESGPSLSMAVIGALAWWLPKYCLGMDVLPTGVSLMCFSQEGSERISRQAWHLDLHPSEISRSAPPYIMFVGFHESFAIWILSKLTGDAALALENESYADALDHEQMASTYDAQALSCRPWSVLFLSTACVHAGMAAELDLLQRSCVWRFHVYLREGAPADANNKKGSQQTFPCEKLLDETDIAKKNKRNE